LPSSFIRSSPFYGRDFTPVDFRIAGFASQAVRALAEGPDGSLWVGTNLGIVRIPDVEHYDPSRSTSRVYRTGDPGDVGVEWHKFTRDGVLLVGTPLGVYRLNAERFVSGLPEMIAQTSAIELEDPSERFLIGADNDY
jgi:ligand-binding sensor domain-containing protein